MVALQIAAMMAFVIMMAMYSLEIKRFFMHLKERHNEVYEALNRPRWNFQLGDPSLRLAMKYIKKKAYRNLEDKTLEEIHDKMKLFGYLATFFAILTLIATFFAG